MGEVISQELAAAMVGLDGPEKRCAKLLVRRGEAAEDVAVARYAVAYARERQRRLKRSSFSVTVAMGVVLGLTGMVVAVYFLRQAVDAKAVAILGFAMFFLVTSWRNWQTMRNAGAAEQVNREYLRRSGAPYVPGGLPIRVYVPPLAVAFSLAIHVAVIVVVGGVVTLLLNEEPLSAGKALSVGISGAVGAVISAVLGIVWARSRDDASDGRSTPEYQHLRDLD